MVINFTMILLNCQEELVAVICKITYLGFTHFPWIWLSEHFYIIKYIYNFWKSYKKYCEKTKIML